MDHNQQPTGNQEEPWTRDQEKRLLRLYAPHPCLYDTYIAVYFTFEERERKYMEICEKLQQFRPNVTVDEIKIKIKHFRRKFHQEMRLIKQAEQDNIVYIPDLWCFESLKNIFHSRPSSSSADSSIEVVVISDGEGESNATTSKTPKDDNKEKPTTKPKIKNKIIYPYVKLRLRRKRKRSEIFGKDSLTDQPTAKSRRSSEDDDESGSVDTEKLNYHGDDEVETIGSIPSPRRYHGDRQFDINQETNPELVGSYVGGGPLSDFDENTMWSRSESERQEFVLRKMYLRDFLKVVNKTWNGEGKDANFYRQYFLYDLDSVANAPDVETSDSSPLCNTFYLFPDEVAGIRVIEPTFSNDNSVGLESPERTRGPEPQTPITPNSARNQSWMYMQPSTSRQALLMAVEAMDISNVPVPGETQDKGVSGQCHGDASNHFGSTSETDTCDENVVLVPGNQKHELGQRSPDTFFDLMGADSTPPLDKKFALSNSEGEIAQSGSSQCTVDHERLIDGDANIEFTDNSRKRRPSYSSNDLWMLLKASEMLDKLSSVIGSSHDSTDIPIDLSFKNSGTSKLRLDVKISCDSGLESGSNPSRCTSPEIHSRVNSNPLPAYLGKCREFTAVSKNRANLNFGANSNAWNYAHHSVRQVGGYTKLVNTNSAVNKFCNTSANDSHPNLAVTNCDNWDTNLFNNSQHRLSNSNKRSDKSSSRCFTGQAIELFPGLSAEIRQTNRMVPTHGRYSSFQVAHDPDNVQRYYCSSNTKEVKFYGTTEIYDRQMCYPYFAYPGNVLVRSKEMKRT